MSDSVYLSTLRDPRLGLTSPLPLEISGSEGNYVASWYEGRIDGEGPTRDAAVEDCRVAVIEKYKSLRAKVVKSLALSPDDDQVWNSLLHFIAEAGQRRRAAGEEYEVTNAADPDYKGPIFG